MLEGRCLCGQIEYEIDGEVGPIAYCHCSYCRRASGSAFAANASILRSTFRFRRGGELIKEFEASPQKFRAFCSNCGSPIYARHALAADLLRIRLGTLGSDPQSRPTGHYDVESKAPWFTIEDRLPQFDERGNPVKAAASADRRLNFVALSVADLASSLCFYRDALGLALHESDHDADRNDAWYGGAHAAYTWTDGAFLHFAIYPARPPERPVSTAAQIGFSVIDFDAIDARITDLGYRVAQPPRDEPWGRTARYLDPDGNIVSITRARH